MRIVSGSAAFTRPADTTAYASGDLVANSTTAGSVSPLSFSVSGGRGFKLHRVGLQRSQATPTNANFRVHFFNDSPTVTNGDNGAIAPTVSGYLGAVDVDGTGAVAFTGGSKTNVSTSTFPTLMYLDGDHTIYALIEARAAYTPASGETFTLSFVGEAYD